MKSKKWVYLSLAAVLALSVGAMAACGEPKEPAAPKQQGLVPEAAAVLPKQKDANKRTKNVSVHDPSVFYDEASKKYYAFGTHYAVASSKDLVEWEQYSSDKQWQKLYDDADPVTYAGKQWPKALKDTLEIVKPEENGNDTISTTWAPDVNFHDGKYYMYYSITKAFGSNQSAIARVESDKVTGPYSNNTVIIESATMTGDHVNCIDPELFTDKEGKLWMVYGSHFAGVYIKELNNSGADWGLPKEKGVGKLLWKGGGQVVEGPFVFYNELTDYYYLMTSYGALMSTYNMRIARSKNPDGPYVDIAGTNVAESSNNGTQHGNKVAGSFEFTGTVGGSYAALGHNSVVKDKNGKYFVVYHARRQTGDSVATPHNLFANQLFFNEEGWPVMSPVAYVGETFGKITQAEAAGDYEIIVHSTGTTIDIAKSVTYTLSADGKIKSGTTDAGTWSMTQDFYITLTLNDIEYKGVVVPGWNNYTAKGSPVYAITAISDLGDQGGGSLWGLCPQA